MWHIWVFWPSSIQQCVKTYLLFSTDLVILPIQSKTSSCERGLNPVNINRSKVLLLWPSPPKIILSYLTHSYKKIVHTSGLEHLLNHEWDMSSWWQSISSDPRMPFNKSESKERLAKKICSIDIVLNIFISRQKKCTVKFQVLKIWIVTFVKMP